jgi:RNA polymerase sigma factor for flagellar operon FliA
MLSQRNARATPVPRPTDALWQRFRASGDREARARLLDGYLGLVLHCARDLARRVSCSVELDDLISAGTVGLVQTLEGFDPARGLAFSTYAVPRIRGAMLDELRGRDWMPRRLRARSRQIGRARADLEQRLGRAPSTPEMASHLEIDLPTCWKWVAESDGRVMLGLDESVDCDSSDQARLAETIPDPHGAQPGDRIEHEEELRQLREAFAELSDRDRLVLTLFYYEGLSQRQIGDVLQVSESRVSQIHARALRRLREHVTLSEAA